MISPKFESAAPFSEGLAGVKLHGKFGYIDKSGTFAVQPRFAGAGRFSEGFAWVVTGKPWTPLGNGEYGFALFGKVTFIDRAGHQVRRPFSAEEVDKFSEELAAVRPGKLFGGCSGKIGYMNTNGDWSIKPRFDGASAFSDGLAAVNEGGKCGLGGKWGYIDKNGNVVIQFHYDYAGPFRSGKACVQESGKWERIDTHGDGIPTNKEQCLSAGEGD